MNPKKRNAGTPTKHVIDHAPAAGRHGWSDGGANRRTAPPARRYVSGKVI